MVLTEAEFVQQYTLQRAGAVSNVPDLSGIIEDGKSAFKEIESKCNAVRKNNINKP